ncbi:SdrD B-like domain-containing protein [Macrococcus sp. CCM 2573]
MLYDLGDKVWYDADKDGLQGTDEIGIPNVTVTLSKPDGTVIATTTTDANGNYIFKDLPNGDYIVTFETPDGYNGPTVVNAGDDALDSDGQVVNVTIKDADNMTIDSGFIKVKVGDTVWEDKNHDGVQDAGEPGIPGVEVTITYPDGTTETVVTDENGYYEFPNVPNGESTIEFKAPDGYIPTTENVGDDTKDSDGTKVKVSVDGKDDPTIDSGFIKVYDLGDKVWFDEDKDGIQDANESGIEGVKVTLTKPDGTTVTTTTDANGNYIFKNLPNGDYVVTFETPAGMDPTKVNVGDDALDSDGTSVKVTIKDADNMTIDSGFVKTPVVPIPKPQGNLELGDKVWFDKDKDGIQDANESGIEGVKVTLTKPDGTVIATTTTDANGNYIFTGLEPGDYVVTFETPAGMDPTKVNVGDDALDSDGTSVKVHLTENDYTIDSGFVVKEVPTEPGKEVPTEPGKEVPTEPGKEVPTEPGKEVPTEPGKEIPTEPGKEVPTEPGKEVPTESGKEVPTESGKEVPTESGKDTPTLGKEVKELPDTGEANNSGLSAALLAGLGGLLLFRRKK